MGSKLRILFQFVRWGLLTGAASMLALGVEMLPAAADELNEWSYDSQTRSLNLTVPSDVSPSVSVISPDQLLIELPDTQVGDVPGLTVNDGVVESIELEQISSETLWVVMEFAEGTVLSGAQSAVPVGEVASGQQWQVRPDFIASSESTLSAVDNGPAETDESVVTNSPVVPNVVTSGGADILRTPEVDVAQADFPDLPILEPGITLNEPISVPPIDASPSVSVPPPPPPIAEANSPAAIADLPAEPPFLGEETFEVPVIDETALSEEMAEEEVEEIANDPIVDEPIVNAASNETIEGEIAVEVEKIPVESVVSVESEPSVEADAIPGDAVPEDTVATARGLRTRVDASFAEESAATEDEAEPEEIDFAAQGVVPQNTDRWPEPIPFGAPLPR